MDMRREKPGEKDGDVDPGPQDSIRTALHIVQNVKMVCSRIPECFTRKQDTFFEARESIRGFGNKKKS